MMRLLIIGGGLAALYFMYAKPSLAHVQFPAKVSHKKRMPAPSSGLVNIDLDAAFDIPLSPSINENDLISFDDLFNNKPLPSLETIIEEIVVESTKGSWKPPAKAAPYLNAFSRAERKYALPKNLLARVAWQESRFRDDIISGKTKSSAGAVGIMQIIPRWHPTVNPWDPIASIDYAGSYLRSLFNQFGTWDKALAGYNWGPGNVRKAIGDLGTQWLTLAPRETRNYVKEISQDVKVA